MHKLNRGQSESFLNAIKAFYLRYTSAIEIKLRISCKLYKNEDVKKINTSSCIPERKKSANILKSR